MRLTSQSNYITFARYNFNMYEKKVLFAIVDGISPSLKGVIDVDPTLRTEVIHSIEGKIKYIRYHAKDLCEPQHYSRLRDALKNLQSKQIIIDTEEYEIGTSPVLEYDFRKGKETVTIAISVTLWQFLFDLKKGYANFQVKVALSLPSIYSMRVYELIAKWRNTPKFFISVSDFRNFLQIENKFNQISQLKERVLDKAKKDLDKNPLTDLRFDYKTVKEGRRVVGFDFYVIKTTNAHEIKKSTNNISPRWKLSNKSITFLNEIGIVLRGKTLEIVNEYKSLCKNEKHLINEVNHYRNKAINNGINNKAGYIIGVMKNEIKAHKEINTPQTEEAKKVENLISGVNKLE